MSASRTHHLKTKKTRRFNREDIKRGDVVALVNAGDLSRLGVVLGIDSRREFPFSVRLVPHPDEKHVTIVRVEEKKVKKVYYFGKPHGHDVAKEPMP